MQTQGPLSPVGDRILAIAEARDHGAMVALDAHRLADAQQIEIATATHLGRSGRPRVHDWASGSVQRALDVRPPVRRDAAVERPECCAPLPRRGSYPGTNWKGPAWLSELALGPGADLAVGGPQAQHPEFPTDVDNGDIPKSFRSHIQRKACSRNQESNPCPELTHQILPLLPSVSRWP